jgi:DNA repair exonuclease SbcCD nuclease subunit
MSEHPRPEAVEGVYRGILCIGDPHLCTWPPGYRKDEYPRVILEKLRWSLHYARENRLLPVLLGDLFHVPRNNANWLVIQLMAVLEGEILTLVGNHDLSENLLSDHDTLQLLLAAGRLRRLDQHPWIGNMNGKPIAIGGTDYGLELPKSVDRSSLGDPRFVFWMTHHEVAFPGWPEGYHRPCEEIPGIDLIVNGHIHREVPDVVRGMTTWCNPGNIARLNRTDLTREHTPAVLRIDVTNDGWMKTRVEIPHKPFEEVFHPIGETPSADAGESSFITGLQSMQKFKTSEGEGLRRLIETNLPRFSDERVKKEILILLKEVLPNARIQEAGRDDRATAKAL